MNAPDAESRGWLAWTVATRRPAFVTAVVLAGFWVVLAVWCTAEIVRSVSAGTEVGDNVLLLVFVGVALAVWLGSWPLLAYERWMLAVVPRSVDLAWTTRISRADAKLLQEFAEHSDVPEGEPMRGGIHVFSLTSSAIVFWAVRSRRLWPILTLPVDRIESVWRADYAPSVTYVSLVGVDPKRFVALSPGRGRLRRLIRDREDGFRAISHAVGPKKVRVTEVRRKSRTEEGPE